MDGGEVDEEVSLHHRSLDPTPKKIPFQFQVAFDQLTRTHTNRLTDLQKLLEQTRRTALLPPGQAASLACDGAS
jgi:hypothetical protein